MSEWLRDREAEFAQGRADLEESVSRIYRQVVSRDGAVPPPAAPAKRETPGAVNKAPPAAEGMRQVAVRTRDKASALLRDAASNGLVRKLAGENARTAGNAAGLVTGTSEMARNLFDGAILVGRLLDVTDPFRSPPGEAAWDQVMGGAGAIVDVGRRIVSDPRGVAHDVAEKGRQINRETNPYATPEAPTLAEEIGRSFRIGRREGELGVQVFPYLVGAGELKGALELASISKGSRVAKYISQGFTPTEADYLAAPYSGMGHHAILPRRTKLPPAFGGGPVPIAISDSRFNVVKPPGISRGDMYELHYKVDPNFTNAPLRRPGRWVGSRIGLERYGPVDQVWFGTPTATKRGFAGVGIAGTVPFADGGEQ
jgi:hypothetical protein